MLYYSKFIILIIHIIYICRCTIQIIVYRNSRNLVWNMIWMKRKKRRKKGSWLRLG